VLAAHALMPGGLGDGIHTAIAILVGAATYGIALWTFDRDRVMATYRFVRSGRSP
jgi:hypothetical protein